MRALFIAYHFPPTGGAGTQRSSKMVRFLPESGVEPIVLCGPGPAHSRWEPEDMTLGDDIPAGIEIHRATPRAPDEGFANWWGAEIARLGPAIVAADAPEVILVTMSPFEGLAPALALGHRYDLPVVADLRDPWALDEVRKYRTRWHRRRERQTMGALLSRCAVVVMNTPEAGAALQEAFPFIDPHSIAVVPNGYDSDDFAVAAADKPQDEFRIVHTGYLHTELAAANRRLRAVKTAAGGWLWPVDLATRSHVHLLQAVSSLATSAPDLAKRTRVVLAGVLTESDKAAISDSPAAASVTTTGYVTHGEAIALMKSADCLFLPMHDIPDGRRARIVPGKTYEYLASGAPILAAVPYGDARDLVTAMHAGVVVPPSDVVGMAQALRMLADSPQAFRAARPGLESFERRSLASEMAGILIAARNS